MIYRNFIVLAICLLTTGCNTGEKALPVIPFERSNGTQTATFEETLEFCQSVAKLSPYIEYKTIGYSAQNRPIPLLIIDRHKEFTPHEVRLSGKSILLIQANIHPGEPDGNDAGMLLIKKMIQNRSFPTNVTILFLPVFNPDGLARFGAFNRINQNGPDKMGWRTTAQNYNLNRDFVKAESPEMQAWLQFFHQWLPDMTIDCHVTDGADYQYVMTYVLETFADKNSLLNQWRNNYIEKISHQMDSAGFPMFPYVTFRRWHDPRSGLYSRPPRPLLSNGYVAVLNRIGLLLEAHSLKPFKQRVEATLACLEMTIKHLEKHGEELHSAIKETDNLSMKTDSIAFKFSQSPTPDTVMFRGVEYSTVKSTITGGEWFVYQPENPQTFSIPFYHQNTPESFVKLPEAYIFGPEWRFIKDRLDWHGIRYFRLQNQATLNTILWRLGNPEWQNQPFEGRFWLKKVDISTDTTPTLWEKESIVVPIRQPKLRLIAWMFEPSSPDSFLQSGFFNIIFERKEYFETYVMEPMAKAMLDTIPNLSEKFRQWKSQNPNADQYQQLEWFYRQTPYYDRKHNLYPVGALLQEDLANLMRIN